MTPGHCAGCDSVATRELLTIPGRESFPVPVLSCEHGARVYGIAFTRRLPTPAPIPDPDVAAEPDKPAPAGYSRRPDRSRGVRRSKARIAAG